MAGSDKINEGQIHVELHVKNGLVDNVSITSDRSDVSARMFKGRDVVEVTQIIGSVFSLCSKAQTIAALEAIEAAQGIYVSDAQKNARECLRIAEMITQTAMRLGLGWPHPLGLEQNFELVRQCMATEVGLEKALMNGAGWKISGGIDIDPDRAVANALKDPLGERIAGIFQAGGYVESIYKALEKHDLMTFGALKKNELPEIGAFTRQWNNELVLMKRLTYGAGLAARFEAVLADLKFLFSNLVGVIENLSSDGVVPQNANGSGEGYSDVETARGNLHHEVKIKDGKVEEYRIEAPTELNFSDDGPVVTGLVGVDASNEEALARAAELHILAIDPCVQFTMEISHA